MRNGIQKQARNALLLAASLLMAACGGGGSPSQTAAPVAVASAVTWFVPEGTTLDAVQTENLVDNGQLYFNVQSATNSSGEIGGGISPPAATFPLDNGDPFAANPSNTPVTFAAVLDGDQVRPRNVITAANGYGSVTLDPLTRRLSGFIVTAGISGNAAQIKDALPGAAGATVLALEGGPVVWTVPANTLLTDAQISRLTSGAYYFSVSSDAFPTGEIRGQLDQQVRCAALKGSSEVPPVTTGASGVGYLALKKSALQFTGFVKLSGIGSTITAVFLQTGPSGSNGPPVATLENRGNGIWALPQNTVLSAAQATAFNNDELYFNVHTVSNLGGEIRGQLLKAGVKIASAALDGSKETPPVITQGSGVARVAFNPVTGLLSGSLSTDKVAGTQARILSGSSAATGTALVTLSTASPVIVTPKPTISFSLDIQPIFTAHCSSTLCHVTGGIAPMSLQPGLAYAGTINLVIPGNSTGSYFMQRLTGAIKPQMPLAGSPLGTTDLDMIRAWIDSGAPNN